MPAEHEAAGGDVEPRNAARGRLVVIEGIDGTGKTTLARALAMRLESMGVSVVASREPTDGPYGRRIREIARSGRDGVTAAEEVELFVADRREHVAGVIAPALDAGKVVVLDRYYFSTMAYQGARAAELAPREDADAVALRKAARIRELHRDFAPAPDLLVLLRLDVDEALRRVTESRGDAPDSFEGRESLRRVAAVFDSLEGPGVMRLDARSPVETLVASVLARLGFASVA